MINGFEEYRESERYYRSVCGAVFLLNGITAEILLTLTHLMA
jgi:hypothetical protein